MDELIQLTERLLHSIASADWATYESLCDPTITAFEPEACGHLVEGMDFHRFYFEMGREENHQTTLVQPHVRMLGDDVAIVSYNRLVQSRDSRGNAVSTCSEETARLAEEGRRVEACALPPIRTQSVAQLTPDPPGRRGHRRFDRISLPASLVGRIPTLRRRSWANPLALHQPTGCRWVVFVCRHVRAIGSLPLACAPARWHPIAHGSRWRVLRLVRKAQNVRRWEDVPWSWPKLLGKRDNRKPHPARLFLELAVRDEKTITRNRCPNHLAERNLELQCSSDRSAAVAPGQ